jgi:uncharacterized FlaG/YvyC family protein
MKERFISLTNYINENSIFEEYTDNKKLVEEFEKTLKNRFEQQSGHASVKIEHDEKENTMTIDLLDYSTKEINILEQCINFVIRKWFNKYLVKITEDNCDANDCEYKGDDYIVIKIK